MKFASQATVEPTGDPIVDKAVAGSEVAIKKCFQDMRYKNREVLIMKELYHPNVIELKNAFFTTGERSNEQYLNIVMQYVPDTLQRTLKIMKKTSKFLPEILIKLYAY